MTLDARPARFDNEGTDGLAPSYRYCNVTEYPSLGRVVYTAWLYEPAAEPFPWASICETRVLDGATNYRLRTIPYDPTRVTVGGMAEAHEAACAAVEREAR